MVNSNFQPFNNTKDSNSHRHSAPIWLHNIWRKIYDSRHYQYHCTLTYQFSIFPSGSSIHSSESTTSKDVFNGISFLEAEGVFLFHCKKKHVGVDVGSGTTPSGARGIDTNRDTQSGNGKFTSFMFLPFSSFTFPLRNTFRLLIFRANIFDILEGDENIACEHERSCTSNPYSS